MSQTLHGTSRINTYCIQSQEVSFQARLLSARIFFLKVGPCLPPNLIAESPATEVCGRLCLIGSPSSTQTPRKDHVQVTCSDPEARGPTNSLFHPNNLPADCCKIKTLQRRFCTYTSRHYFFGRGYTCHRTAAHGLAPTPTPGSTRLTPARPSGDAAEGKLAPHRPPRLVPQVSTDGGLDRAVQQPRWKPSTR